MSTRSSRSRAATAQVATSKPVKSRKAEPQQLSSPPATPQPAKKKRDSTKADSTVKQTKSPRATPKRSSTAKRVKVEDDDDLPHNLGSTKSKVSPEKPLAVPANKRRRTSKKDEALPAIVKDEEVQTTASIAASAPGTPKKSKSKDKNNSYGLTPGQTPYPDWPHPTPEECHEVTRLLSKLHGKVQAPKSIPQPSLTVSGCGEVPSVLDALIRTRLSAATNNQNSSRAFQGLVKRFGVLESGIGKGSVNWDAVRRADVKDIFEAIKSGGLADVKSKDIKQILQMVYEENQARRAALKSSSSKPAGADNESKDEKSAEIARAEENVISLDHLHLLSNDEAFNALTKYPGIGPKTASCVLLFCLQRPSFAVDTHVFRLCKWLGWVPADKATRNSTYAHCEVRIPDELKYPLHYLFIKHGRTCGRCRAITGEGSADWSKGCPIEHLVTRSGGRKGGANSSPLKGTPKGKKRKQELDSEDEAVETDEAENDGSDDEQGANTEKQPTTRKRLPRRSTAKSAPVVKSDMDEDSDNTDAASDDYVD